MKRYKKLLWWAFDWFIMFLGLYVIWFWWYYIVDLYRNLHLPIQIDILVVCLVIGIIVWWIIWLWCDYESDFYIPFKKK